MLPLCSYIVHSIVLYYEYKVKKYNLSCTLYVIEISSAARNKFCMASLFNIDYLLYKASIIIIIVFYL